MQFDGRQPVTMEPDFYRARIEQIRAYLDGQAYHGLLLLHPVTIMWASGFFHIPNERPLGLYIAPKRDPVLFVPFLEKENAEASWIQDIRWYWEYPGESAPEVWMMQQIDGERIAIDGASYEMFATLSGVKPELQLDRGVARMRYVKHEAELALMRQAAAYADFGLEVARAAVSNELRDGITELDVVRVVQMETTSKMGRELADLVNFYGGAVVLTAHTGARAALPHGQPGPVAVAPGDTLIVGIGVTVGGYHAESGCTFVVGEPNRDQRRCLEATWACNEAAVAALWPGMRCQDVDTIALNVLREAGYAEHIRHRIGHGIGMEGHEAPWLSEGDQTTLAPSMVFSNEPGVYRPGVDGYRIIDTMVVTNEGGQRLSRYLSEHGPEDRVIPV